MARWLNQQPLAGEQSGTAILALTKAWYACAKGQGVHIIGTFDD